MSDRLEDNIVRVAAGEIVRIELYQQALQEEGIDAKVVGDSLDSGFGTAMPDSIELWVHEDDRPRALEVIRQVEEGKK